MPRKTMRTVIPTDPDTDVDVLRWLTRESFELAAGRLGLTVVSYAEREVPWTELPPKAAEHLPMSADRYVWREFLGVAEVPAETIEWLTAESLWWNTHAGVMDDA